MGRGSGRGKRAGGRRSCAAIQACVAGGSGRLVLRRSIKESIKDDEKRWGSLTMAVLSKAVATSFCVRETIEGAFWDAEARDPGREDRALADGEATEVGSGTPAPRIGYNNIVNVCCRSHSKMLCQTETDIAKSAIRGQWAKVAK